MKEPSGVVRPVTGLGGRSSWSINDVVFRSGFMTMMRTNRPSVTTFIRANRQCSDRNRFVVQDHVAEELHPFCSG
jgi:hypothetical protein